MNKSMYSDDIIWYDPVVKKSIEKLDDKYPNAIPVFGCALSASKYTTTNFEKFVSFIPQVINNAKFFGWHEDAVATIHRFCHLCFIDPMLVEAYIGMSFNELFEGV